MRRQSAEATVPIPRRPAAPVTAVRAVSALLAVLAAGAARADVRLPAIFADHMVLQRDASVPVWGWADPGEEVAVSLAGQAKTALADAHGRWTVTLGRLPAGGPHTLTVRGKNSVAVRDVLVGEVWLASGQSNMEMTVRQARDFAAERAAANHPRIRMFTVRHHAARAAQTDCVGAWQVCSPQTVGSFSATAYFFGRDLHGRLGVPIGLINSSVGGTPVEAWTSLEAQKGQAELRPLLASWERRAAAYDPDAARAAYEKQQAAWRTAAARARADGKPAPRPPQRPADPRDNTHYPGVLYNGMIAPLIPYGIRGAIWYQGESNAGSEESGARYGVQLPLLVRDWRTRWAAGDFPFGWVQLPNFQTRARGWPAVREAMRRALSLPNTGMAIAIDLGEENDIHPKNKQAVGRRLALWARARVYGEPVAWSGPLPAGSTIQGGAVEVRFRHADGGLRAEGGELRGFEVAGPDGLWHRATARIEGGKVIASSGDVKQPTAVRYDWAANPDGNLANGAGLPASPFRLGGEGSAP